MGALKLQQHRAGTIRRVVRVSGHFVCGLCRNHYADMRVARGCLEQCWEDVLAMDPVVAKKHHGHQIHRCRFCARDYEARLNAEYCARECKSKMNRKQLAEVKLGDIEEQPQTKRKFSRKMLLQSVMPLSSGKKKPIKITDPIQEVRVHATVPPMAFERPDRMPVDHTEPVIDQSVSAGNRPKKPKTADIFYRDQAKYVCTVCHAKFFTKLEVTNCWEAHE